MTLRGAFDGIEQCRVLEEATVGNIGINSWQILDNRTTGAQVEVTYFAVAHLTFRKTDRPLRRIELRVRPCRQQPPPHRHICGRYSVSLWSAA